MSNKKEIQQGDNSIYVENVEGNLIVNNPVKELPKELTAKLPKLRLDQTIGRSKDLINLNKYLFEKEQVVLVNGMGGIGKTTLAQVYINEYYDAYQHIAWVELDPDNNDVRNDLVNAKGLLTNLNIDTTGRTIDEIFVAIITALKQIPKHPCLLVLDNADNTLSKIYNYLPTPPHWHVLATAREKIAHFDIVELGFLREADAIKLFKKHYTHRQLNDEDIKQFVNAIDLHTLTIEIMAKTAQRQRITPLQLMQAIEQDLASNVQVRHSDDKIGKITTYLCSTFKIAQLNEAEQNLLLHFVCLPPEMHSYELLKELINGDHLNYNLAETLTELYEKGWLLYNLESDSYKIHRIVNDVVKRTLELSEEKVEILIERITQKLKIDQTKDNPVDKFLWIPFGFSIDINFENSSSEDIIKLQNNLAKLAHEKGDYVVAGNLWKKIAQSSEKIYGASHPNTAASFANIALLFQTLGKYKEANDLLEIVKQIIEDHFGQHHENTAAIYGSIGLVLIGLKDFIQAKKYLKKALKINEQIFGRLDPKTALNYTNLAVALAELGDSKAAKDLMEKALQSVEYNFGMEHPSTAIRYSNLSSILRDLEDYLGAILLMNKAKKILEKNFGQDHPSTADCYCNLATLHTDLQNYASAKELLEIAIPITEKYLGEQHHKTITSKGNLEYVIQLINTKSS